jgi:hypothetical protein
LLPSAMCGKQRAPRYWKKSVTRLKIESHQL